MNEGTELTRSNVTGLNFKDSHKFLTKREYV